MQVNHASGYIEEKNENKYLIVDDSVNENKEVLKKYGELWNGIKNEIKTINDGKERVTWRLRLILTMTYH